MEKVIENLKTKRAEQIQERVDAREELEKLKTQVDADACNEDSTEGITLVVQVKTLDTELETLMEQERALMLEHTTVRDKIQTLSSQKDMKSQELNTLRSQSKKVCMQDVNRNRERIKTLENMLSECNDEEEVQEEAEISQLEGVPAVGIEQNGFDDAEFG